MFRRAKSFTLPTENSARAVTTTPDSASRDHRDLIPIESKNDVEKLMKAILEPFVSKVEIHESGLLDALIARNVINDIDNESLDPRNRGNRRERARHLWKILCKISHEVFVRDALPVLCEKAGFIIPAEFWKRQFMYRSKSEVVHKVSGPDEKEENPHCLRCALRRRLRMSEVAGFLYRHGVMNFDTYSNLTKDKYCDDQQWNDTLDAFARISRPDAQRYRPEMKRMLSDHSLHVPDDLVDLITQGFPCRCFPAEPKRGSLTPTELSSFFSTLSSRRSSLSSSRPSVRSLFPGSSSSIDDLSDTLSTVSENTVLKEPVESPSARNMRSVSSQHREGKSPLQDIQTWSGTRMKKAFAEDDAASGQKSKHISIRPSSKKRVSIVDAVSEGLFGRTQPRAHESRRLSFNGMQSKENEQYCKSETSPSRQEEASDIRDDETTSVTEEQVTTCKSGWSAGVAGNVTGDSPHDSKPDEEEGVRDSDRDLRTSDASENASPKSDSTESQGDGDPDNPLEIDLDQLVLQDGDLDELHQYVETTNPTAETLADMLESVSPDVKEVLGDLVRACSEVEDEYKGILAKMNELVTTSQVPSSSDGQSLLQQSQQRFEAIDGLCKELLVWHKAFTMCNIFLHTVNMHCTEQTHWEVQAAARDVLLRVSDTMNELVEKLPNVTQSQENPCHDELLKTLAVCIQKFLDKF